ncbi:MAG: serine/threonine protein kinase [Armatimonadetes bacterium]|nr:serine/threonine protein kinase [Armatimonadota bacterium]
MSLEPGNVLEDRYEIVRTLQCGGMGAVYEARDRRLDGTPCAVKEMLDGLDQVNAQYVEEKFEQEVRVLTRLDHQGIPRVRDSFVTSEKRYIVMDFVAGSNLEQELEAEGPFSTDRAVAVGLEILDILEYLHSRECPLVHRDVKPANLIREQASGRIKLVDFGLASLSGGDSTRTNVGTLAYCPMEQMQGRPEPRSDLYALGATLLHLALGAPPVPLRPATEAANWDRLDSRLKSVIQRAMTRESAKRFRSAAAMRAALASRPMTTALPSPDPSIPVPSHEAVGTFRTGRILISVVFLAALLCLLPLLPQSSPPALASATAQVRPTPAPAPAPMAAPSSPVPIAPVPVVARSSPRPSSRPSPAPSPDPDPPRPQERPRPLKQPRALGLPAPSYPVARVHAAPIERAFPEHGMRVSLPEHWKWGKIREDRDRLEVELLAPEGRVSLVSQWRDEAPKEVEKRHLNELRRQGWRSVRTIPLEDGSRVDILADPTGKQAFHLLAVERTNGRWRTLTGFGAFQLALPEAGRTFETVMRDHVDLCYQADA